MGYLHQKCGDLTKYEKDRDTKAQISLPGIKKNDKMLRSRQKPREKLDSFAVLFILFRKEDVLVQLQPTLLTIDTF